MIRIDCNYDHLLLIISPFFYYFSLHLGEVVFSAPAAVAATEGVEAAVSTVTLTITLTKEDGLNITVTNTADNTVLGSLVIPSV